MNRRKVVTLCGSVRFWDKIQELYEKLELENKYAVIGITPHVMNRNFTEDEEKLLDELHRIKIDLADAIYVVNVNGYIGKSTREEIEYAEQKGKEIMYLEKINWWINCKVFHDKKMSAFVLVVAEEIGAKYIVPTDIAMAYGILNI